MCSRASSKPSSCCCRISVSTSRQQGLSPCTFYNYRIARARKVDHVYGDVYSPFPLRSACRKAAWVPNTGWKRFMYCRRVGTTANRARRSHAAKQLRRVGRVCLGDTVVQGRSDSDVGAGSLHPPVLYEVTVIFGFFFSRVPLLRSNRLLFRGRTSADTTQLHQHNATTARYTYQQEAEVSPRILCELRACMHAVAFAVHTIELYTRGGRPLEHALLLALPCNGLGLACPAVLWWAD